VRENKETRMKRNIRQNLEKLSNKLIAKNVFFATKMDAIRHWASVVLPEIVKQYTNSIRFLLAVQTHQY